MNPITACIALGSNLGCREEHLAYAIKSLNNLEEVSRVRVSQFMETEPVSPIAQGMFLNAAATLQTTLAPHDLLQTMLEIERQRGRQRENEVRHGPRILDLDLLLYGDLILNTPELTVPHPRLHERTFVLEPLATIAPNLRHPRLDLTVTEMLANWNQSKSEERIKTSTAGVSD